MSSIHCSLLDVVVPLCNAVTKGVEFLLFKRYIGKLCSGIVDEQVGHTLVDYFVQEGIPKGDIKINTTCS